MANTAISERLRFLEERIGELGEKINALYRAIHGYNGTVGVVGILDRIQGRVNDLENKMGNLENEIKEIGNRISGIEQQMAVESERHTRERVEDQSITFRFLVEKVFLPLILPLIGGGITYLITSAMNGK
jgi:hypothetical protein